MILAIVFQGLERSLSSPRERRVLRPVGHQPTCMGLAQGTFSPSLFIFVHVSGLGFGYLRFIEVRVWYFNTRLVGYSDLDLDNQDHVQIWIFLRFDRNLT